MVGGIGVLVGGIGVLVGGIGVLVGGIGVLVGGTGVSVGGTGVSDRRDRRVGCGWHGCIGRSRNRHVGRRFKDLLYLFNLDDFRDSCVHHERFHLISPGTSGADIARPYHHLVANALVQTGQCDRGAGRECVAAQVRPGLEVFIDWSVADTIVLRRI